MKAIGIVQSVSPIVGMANGDKKPKKAVEYDRLEVMFDGDLTGYAHINCFVPGKYKPGDKLELKGVGQD